ncbi:MAG: hypothetical protein ACJAQU_002352 [Loktanella salsilacus]
MAQWKKRPGERIFQNGPIFIALIPKAQMQKSDIENQRFLPHSNP